MKPGPVISPPGQENQRKGQGFARPGGASQHWLTCLSHAPDPEAAALDRALVAGLLLEVLLENPSLAEKPGVGCQRLKDRLKHTLACQLAGRIPLASFHSLLLGLDQWFEEIYPLLAEGGFGGTCPGARRPPARPKFCALREELFREAVEKTPGLLPHRRHRKLDVEKLRCFLENTGGEWFRLRDFERHFQVERKTAWEYVQKLLQIGLLVHNQGHSSAVRYRLASRFVKLTWPEVTEAAPEVLARRQAH